MNLITDPENLEDEVWTSIRRLKENLLSHR